MTSVYMKRKRREAVIQAAQRALDAQVECLAALAEISTTGDEPLDERVMKAYEQAERVVPKLLAVMIGAKYSNPWQDPGN